MAEGCSAPNNRCKMCENGVTICGGCIKQFCDKHYQEHRQQLALELDHIIYDHDMLRQHLFAIPSTLNQNKQDILRTIDEWQEETIEKIKQAANNAREKVHQLVYENEKIKQTFQSITNDIRVKSLSNIYAEQDLERWKQQLKQYNSQNFTKPVLFIKTINTDWTTLIKVEKDKSNRYEQSIIEIIRLKAIKPRVVIDIADGSWSALGSSPKFFIHYRHNSKTSLCLITEQGKQISISWDNEQCRDLCWSTHLNRFLILTPHRIYTLNEQTHRIQQLSLTTKDIEYRSCTCSDQTILITYYGHGKHIEEYIIEEKGDWKLLNQWPMKVNEFARHIRFSHNNKNIVGLMISDTQNNWHFELRSRTMELLQSIPLDNSPYYRFVLPCFTSEWLITHNQANILSIIDQHAKTKQTLEFHEKIRNTAFVDQYNCLLIYTCNNQLQIYDL